MKGEIVSDACKEIEDKLAVAYERLDATLVLKQEAEKAVTEAEIVLREHREALLTLGRDEGNARLHIRELNKMRNALESILEISESDSHE